MRFYFLIRPGIYLCWYNFLLVNKKYEWKKHSQMGKQFPIKVRQDWMYQAARNLLFKPIYIQAKNNKGQVETPSLYY